MSGTVLIEVHIKDQTSDTYYVKQIKDNTSGVTLENSYYTIPWSAVNIVILEQGSTYDHFDIVGINILNNPIHLKNDTTNGGAFKDCINLRTLIIRTSSLILESNVFENAGNASSVSGPNASRNGVTIVYKVNASTHSYAADSFTDAYISEFILYADSVSIAGEPFQTPEFPQSGNTQTFFGTTEPNGVLLLESPVTVSSTEPDLCFIAGTMIETDEGTIPIEEVTPSNNIRGMSVSKVSKRLSQNTLVIIKKDAFGVNRPNKDTMATDWHGIYVNDSDTQITRLFDLVDNKRVIKQPNIIKYIYNIELKDKHSYMFANNLKVETVPPGTMP